MTNYERAVELDPTTTSAYISMARIWAAAKQNDLAIEKLKTAIKLAPDDAAPYKDLIELYIRTGQYDKVTPLLDKYVSLTGDDTDAKVRFVKFLTFQAKDYDRAIGEGEKLLETNPEQYTIHRWLAWAYGEKGEYEHSLEHSEKLFKELEKKEERAAFPSDYDYWGKAAYKMGKLDDAAHIYRKYLELEPSRSQEILGTLAKGYFDVKNYAQAIKYYLLKGEEKPLSVADNYYLGLAYYYNDEDLKADSVFVKVLEVTPDYAPGWMMRARIGNRLDTSETKLFLSKVPYEQYIQYASGDPEKNLKNLKEAYKYLAYYYIQQDDFPSAKQFYEKIVELDPTDQDAIDNLKLLNERR
jgi:tetratricopeptide (TPR) repeat protein